MDGPRDMDGTRANVLSCLRVPDLHLPKAGIAFSTLLYQIVSIHFFNHTFHTYIFGRLRLTPIITQMLTGLLMSPFAPWSSTKGLYEVHAALFPAPTQNVDESLAMLSYMMYTFLIAVKMDFSIVLKTGRKAFVIGILDVLIPIFLDLLFLLHLYPDLFQMLRDQDRVVSDLYINLMTLPLTHFPNVAVLLSDMKMINSELGRLALSSALIGHILSAFLIVIANIITRRITNPLKLTAPFLLVIVSIFVLRPIFKWMVKHTSQGRQVKQGFVFLGFLFMFLGALITQYAEQLVLLGAFIVGSVLPDGPPLGAAIVHKLDFFVSAMLTPFFVTTAVMAGDYTNLLTSSNKITFYHLCLAILAYLAKFANSFGCCIYNQMNFNDALALGFIMSIKGIVDIGTLVMFRESEVLSVTNYTMMIVWTLFVATFSPVFVKSLYHPLRKYAGYQRRDIMHCKYNSELRVLTCFIKSDRATSVTRFLNACCPSENNRMVVYTLHLVKLVGRAHPIFINHDKKKKDLSFLYSDEVIWAFDRFSRTCKDFLSVHIYTAVSPQEAMHEDMCTLALDKLVSVIILPFHLRYRFNGSIDSEDTYQRTLNSDILKSSPCSVGILIDRGSFKSINEMPNLTNITTTESDSPFLVALIYIGGLDDQETLAFAKRIGRDSRVKIFVIRLITFGQSDLDPLDSAALMDIQRNILYNNQFFYTEKVVKDGGDTITFLMSMVESYNLIMVGRNYNFACPQLMGLKEMNEDNDLGVIGDFLASEDLHGKTSSLVVQQQRHWKIKI